MALTAMKWTKTAVICFYLLLIIGLALYDEKLTPELVRDMAQPLPEIMEPGNAWIACLGFDAPQGVSPYDYGEEKMRKCRDALRSDKKLRERLRPVEDDKSRLIFKGKIPSFYGAKDSGMLAFAAAHPDDVDTLASNNGELLRRYEGLVKYTRYNEPLDDGHFAPVVGYMPIKNACQMKLLQLAGKAGQGDLETALEGVQEDAEFWRLISRSSYTLISKMVAFAILRIHLRFTAELGASRQLNGKELAMVGDILRPFDNGEIGFVGTLQGEMRYVQHSIELMRQQSKSWDFANVFWKPNASGNRYYSDWQAAGCTRVAEMSSQQFADDIKKGGLDQEVTRRMGVAFLYNPVGEIVCVRNAWPNKSQLFRYAAVGHDLEGFRRLSWLKVLSRKENIPAEVMQQFLDSHKADLGNPYTGGAMTWDPNRSSISFTTFDGGGRHTLAIHP